MAILRIGPDNCPSVLFAALLSVAAWGGSLACCQTPANVTPAGWPSSAGVMGAEQSPTGTGPQEPSTVRGQTPPGLAFPGATGTRSALPGEMAEARVVDVQVVGARRTPVEEILRHIRTRKGRLLDPELVEDDARRLWATRKFVDVKPRYQEVPGGRIVIFEVFERPIIEYVKYVGNEKISRKNLEKESGIKPGDALDPFAVEEGRRRLEEFYHSKGFTKVGITIVEGNKTSDRGAVYLINEGPKQRIGWTNFIGNTIASDARLRTKIQSKPGIFWIFKGELHRKQIEEDIERLTAYYRSLGFFRAKVSVLPVDPTKNWQLLTFVINEGPRYVVRNVSFVGNTRFSREELAEKLELNSGEFFNQSKMQRDRAAIIEAYGAVGHIFADVEPDPRLFLEEPGQLDLVYRIQEGRRYRVGRIDPRILGDNPHTKITTVMNRISLSPGDIVDTREIRASERRLKASGLFEYDPMRGIAPQIVIRPPELEDMETGIARHPGGRSGHRGQSPDPTPHQAFRPPQPQGVSSNGSWLPERLSPNPSPPTPLPASGARGASFVTASLPASGARGASFVTASLPASGARGASFVTASLPASGARGASFVTASKEDGGDVVVDLCVEGRWAGKPQPVREPPTNDPQARVSLPHSDSEMVIRGQYSADAGQSIAPLRRPDPWFPAQPSPRYGDYLPPIEASSSSSESAPAYPSSGGSASAAPDDAASGGSAFAAPRYPPAGGSAPDDQARPTVGPEAAAPAASSPRYGSQFGTGPARAPAEGYQPVDVLPPLSGGPTVSDPSLLLGNPPSEDPPLFVPLEPEVFETRTGRLMFSVGVNSEAGLIGSMIVDEQNFDITRFPRSFEDIRNGTAFRGGGQRFRLEAIPGTQVQRYAVNFQEPYLFDSAISLGVSGFFYTRWYREWDEERLGGRVALGYQFTHDLSGTIAFRGAKIEIFDPIETPAGTPDEILDVLGSNALYGLRGQLAHDTRDNAFLATEGHYFEIGVEQVIGSFNYTRGNLDLRKYFLLRQHPDGSGRHVLSLSFRGDVSSDDTPVYEHYYAGGFSTMRGFDYRGASPRDPATGVLVGGEFRMLASIEYMFPLTADGNLRAVAFCDTGTVEPKIDQWTDNYRVAPGIGLRIVIPTMGPAPIALDFAFPISKEPGDETEVFSFFIGFLR